MDARLMKLGDVHWKTSSCFLQRELLKVDFYITDWFRGTKRDLIWFKVAFRRTVIRDFTAEQFGNTASTVPFATP